MRVPAAFIRAAVVAATLTANLSAAELVSSPVGEYHVSTPEGTSAWMYGLLRNDLWSGTITDVTPNMELAPGRLMKILNLDCSAVITLLSWTRVTTGIGTATSCVVRAAGRAFHRHSNVKNPAV